MKSSPDQNRATGWLIGILLIATAALVVLWPRKPVPPRPRDMTLRFGYFTNITGVSAALFVCSNNSGIRLALDLKSIEYRSKGGTWQSVTGFPTVAGVRTTQGISLTGQADAPWIFPVHDTNVAWRLRVLCVEATTGVEGVIDKATDTAESIAKYGKLGTVTRYEGRNYEVIASSD